LVAVRLPCVQVIRYEPTPLEAVAVVVQAAVPVTPLVASVWLSTKPLTVAVNGLGTAAPYAFD